MTLFPGRNWHFGRVTKFEKDTGSVSQLHTSIYYGWTVTHCENDILTILERWCDTVTLKYAVCFIGLLKWGGTDLWMTLIQGFPKLTKSCSHQRWPQKSRLLQWQKWLLNPGTSSQSEGHSSKWLIWLVCRNPWYIHFHVLLNNHHKWVELFSYLTSRPFINNNCYVCDGFRVEYLSISTHLHFSIQLLCLVKINTFLLGAVLPTSQCLEGVCVLVVLTG